MQQIRLPTAKNFPGEKGKEVVVDKYFFRVFQCLVVIFEGGTEIPVYQCSLFYLRKILFEFTGQNEWQFSLFFPGLFVDAVERVHLFGLRIKTVVGSFVFQPFHSVGETDESNCQSDNADKGL